MPKTYHSSSAAETQKIAAEFVKTIRPGNWIGLYGGLGAGKTVFVKGMAEGFGIDSRHYVNSPTFTLVNDYGPLLHVDLYRLDKPEEVEGLGLEEFDGKIIVVEWAEKLPAAVQLDFRVKITDIGAKERRIAIV